jgi:pimeloyl-ACP methyl ester carboxylesterase
VTHHTIEVDGLRIFHRQAGPPDAPALLLPHGHPCSSFQFRNLMAALGDRWRTVAPDLPGFGHSDTPPDWAPTFEGLTDQLEAFVDAVGLDRYVIWLHDYGSQLGLRLAMRAPERVAGLIIQNGDIYEDTMGPGYEALRSFWDHPTEEGRARLAANVSLEGFRDELVGGLPEHLAERVPPEMWTLHWALMDTPERRRGVVHLFEDQGGTLADFPAQQAHLRDRQPPTLILWGPHDGYMPEEAGRAYLRDLPDAELHVLDAGHWALETNLPEIVPLVESFLDRAWDVPG